MPLPVPPPPASIPSATAMPAPPAAAPAAPAVAPAPAPVASAPPTAAPPPFDADPAPAATAPPAAAPPPPVAEVPAPAAAPVAAAPAAPAAPPAVVEPQQTALAPSDPSEARGSLQAQAEADGFFGLDFGFGACPIISLNNGKFSTSDKVDLGTEFLFIANSSRPKYLYATKLTDDDPRNEVVYSYDQRTNANNETPMSEYLQKWAAAGISYEMKTYVEVEALLSDNTMALLSIPSSGIRRMSKVYGTIKGRGLQPQQTWIKAFVGKEVTNVAKPFLPWDFMVA